MTGLHSLYLLHFYAKSAAESEKKSNKEAFEKQYFIDKENL